MAYLEEKLGQPAGEYSPQLLEIDAKSGPWLAASQQSSLIAKHNYPRFDLDLAEGVMWFGDEERNGVVARAHPVGSYSPEDEAWVWAWTNETYAPLSTAPKQACDAQTDVPEFGLSLIKSSEVKSWTLAAAVGFLMEAETCYRIPGNLQLFVALTELTEIPRDDPRAQRKRQDPAAAAEALREFAGPAALQLGAMLVEALKEGPLDGVIQAVHRVADQLDALAQSPVGRETPAATEAAELARRLRQGTMNLSLPQGHPQLAPALQQVLDLFEATAKHYGAWPEGS